MKSRPFGTYKHFKFVGTDPRDNLRKRLQKFEMDVGPWRDSIIRMNMWSEVTPKDTSYETKQKMFCQEKKLQLHQKLLVTDFFYDYVSDIFDKW